MCSMVDSILLIIGRSSKHTSIGTGLYNSLCRILAFPLASLTHTHSLAHLLCGCSFSPADLFFVPAPLASPYSLLPTPYSLHPTPFFFSLSTFVFVSNRTFSPLVKDGATIDRYAYDADDSPNNNCWPCLLINETIWNMLKSR